MWYIYTRKYYSAEKKSNDILKFAWKWVELEKTILIEVTQTQKDDRGRYPLIGEYKLKTKDKETIVHDFREGRY